MEERRREERERDVGEREENTVVAGEERVVAALQGEK